MLPANRMRPATVRMGIWHRGNGMIVAGLIQIAALQRNELRPRYRTRSFGTPRIARASAKAGLAIR
jgi:hypothetical protein